MMTSQKLDYLLSHAFTALCVMRDIERENDGERAEAHAAGHETRAAFAGGIALAPAEQAALLPLIDAWRKLFNLGKDDDDGRDLAAWEEKIEPILAGLPERQYVVAQDGIDTSGNAF